MRAYVPRVISLRLGGLTVSAGYSFCFLITAALLLDRGGLILLGLAAACCHELAHLLAMWALRMPPAELCLSVLGGRLTRRPGREAGYAAELAVSLAGGLCNVALAAAFRGSQSREGLLFSAVNLALGAFNLLPIDGLDGGRALYSLLCMANGEQRAARLLGWASAATLALLWLWAGYLVLRRQANPTLLLLTAYLTAAFAKRGQPF